MLVVGLTGSIGMGKTTVAGWFAARGFPVLDADQIVHDLYEGAAVEPIAELVPAAMQNGRVDRAKLSTALQESPSLFEQLEAIVHPLVRAAQRDFLAASKASGAPAAILDIPLLFETLGDASMDVTIVVNAPVIVQRTRVLQRPGMTEEKYQTILARQMPAEEKLRLADFVIDTGQTLAESEADVDRLAAALKLRAGTAYRRCWQSNSEIA